MKMRSPFEKIRLFNRAIFILIFISGQFYTSTAYSQSLMWANKFGSSLADQGYSIAVDSYDNVYMCGHFQGTTDFDPGPGVYNLTPVGSADIFFAKFNSIGALLWAKSFGSVSYETSNALILDNNNNIYITGYFAGTTDFDPGPGVQSLTCAGGVDAFIAKYDSMGTYIWTKSIGGVGNEQGRRLTFDSSYSLYITGLLGSTSVDFDPGPGIFNLSSVGQSDVFFAKYDTAGNFVWARVIGGTLTDYCDGIGVDSMKNVYVTGYFQGTADFDPGVGVQNLTSNGGPDIYIARYDSNGTFLWAKRIGGTFFDFGYRLVVEQAGSVIITGGFGDSVDFDPGPGVQLVNALGGFDAFLAKYDMNGNYLWNKQIGGLTDDKGFGACVDDLGNIYLTGFFSGSVDFDPGPGSQILTSVWDADIFFAKYNFQGDYIWAGSAGSNSADYSYDIVVDNQYNVIITGFFQGTSDFNPTTGTYYLTSNGGTDGFLAKYSSSLTSDDEPLFPPLINVIIYPNPMTDRFVISADESEITSVKIYSSVGSLAYSKEGQGMNSIACEISLTSGIYIFEIATDKGDIRKLVVVN